MDFGDIEINISSKQSTLSNVNKTINLKVPVKARETKNVKNQEKTPNTAHKSVPSDLVRKKSSHESSNRVVKPKLEPDFNVRKSDDDQKIHDKDPPKETDSNSLTITNDIIISKSKYKSKTLIEDPLQFHAKPKDLSLNTMKRPIELISNSEHIFTKSLFSSLAVNPRLASLLQKPKSEGGMGLKTATKIQSVVIPALRVKQNVLIKSETGSGKTLAYLIPLLNDLMSLQSTQMDAMDSPASREGGTRAIVIAPTRELCVQITEVLERLTKCCVWIVGGCVTGGEKRKSEKARLRKGIVVVVGTPGRLLDHLKATECFNLSRLRWVVLDEADRLLDMGFEKTILEICQIIRGQPLGVDGADGGGGATRKGNKIQNLSQKFHDQTVRQSKLCKSVADLSFVMASATLTQGVRQLAVPLMGGDRGGSSGFLVVDAEQELASLVRDESDLKRLASAVKRHRVIDMCDGDPPPGDGKSGEDEGGGSTCKRFRAGLDDGEQVDVPKQLLQYHMTVTCKWRLSALLCFLRQHLTRKVMVFFSTCDSVDYHSLLMKNCEWPHDLDHAIDPEKEKDGAGPGGGAKAKDREQSLEPLPNVFTGMLGPQFPIYRLHGNVPQSSRTSVYKEFCAASKGAMFCTDVAARGLDLPLVDWILQYDPPCETTDYVHRVGRTARRGLGGSALIFLLPTEAAYVPLLASHGLSPQALSLQNLFMDGSQHIEGSMKFKNRDEMTAVILQRRVESCILGNRLLVDAARQAFRSFVRAYATHSADTKGIFRVQSLHLGHVAKSFGLRESPTALRNHSDVIGQICAGHFSKDSNGGGGGGGGEARRSRIEPG